MKGTARWREGEVREQPKDYPIGMRFAPSEQSSDKIYTHDEFVFACWLSGIAGVLLTVFSVFLWSL